MAFPTALNSQITDSVTQSNASVLAEAPAVAMGNVYQTAAAAASNAMANAVSTQQNMNEVAKAVTTACVNSLLGDDDLSAGRKK